MSLIDNVLRYAKTSGLVTSTMARHVAENVLGATINHDKHSSNLTLALGNLKGPIMKMAQFLATVPGALPDEYAKAFLSLQTNAPPMSSVFVKRRMQSELGPDWQKHFEHFDMTPTFAASLGQVHHAVLQGQPLPFSKVACKLQYPSMEQAVDADLNQLKIILSLYEIFNDALKTDAIFKEIQEKLKEELDYTQEAKHMEYYGKIFQDHPHIHVPKVINTLSTKHLLTMEWVEGRSLMTFINDTQELRNRLGKNLFYSWYFPFYHHNILHGDPHPGNYYGHSDGAITLLDFGCVRQFDPTFVQGVVDLYRSFQKDDKDLRMHAYESWGFKNLNNAMIEIISDWAKLLMEPLLDNRMRPIQEKITGWDVASNVHSKLQKLGGIRPPQEFVFMDRAAVGVGSVLFHLGSQQNWHKMFEELIDHIPPSH